MYDYQTPSSAPRPPAFRLDLTKATPTYAEMAGKWHEAMIRKAELKQSKSRMGRHLEVTFHVAGTVDVRDWIVVEHSNPAAVGLGAAKAKKIFVACGETSPPNLSLIHI